MAEKKTEAGYAGHRPGSRKEQVHKVFDKKGRDAAIAKAEELDIAPTTARAWVSSWGGGTSRPSKAAAPVEEAAPAKKKKKKKVAA